MTAESPRDALPRHGLAVVVEEWFQGQALASVIQRVHWDRLDSRVELAVAAWLALLEPNQAKATFFVDAFVAMHHGDLLARIASKGHEVRLDRVEDVVRELPAVRVVEGGDLRRDQDGARALGALAEAHAPCAIVFRSWELDTEQPRVTAGSKQDRSRHYEGLDRVPALVQKAIGMLAPLDFAAAFALPPCATIAASPAAPVAAREPQAANATLRVGVVVPMFDEEENVDYLLRSLDELRSRGADRYEFEFVLVDDRSRDATYERLLRATAGRRDVKLVRHDVNRGVSRAILTGIEASTCDIVASIDCDGSYDPLDLLAMLPMLDGADVVTASPYHPRGRVRNVPAWRLLLSQTLSRIYRLVLRSDLHTFTSCCRVHRRERMVGMELSHEGFLGTAEMLVRVLRRGGVVREYPTTLSSRLLGFSKMKTLRTIRGHLGLLVAVVAGRVR